MAYLDRDQLEAATRNLRKHLGIDDQPRPDMMTVIVKMKHAGIIKNYERVKGVLPDSKNAHFDPKTGIMRICEEEFRAINRSVPSARFTVAHEAAHAFLKHKEARYRSAPGKALRVAPDTLKRDEFQANYFSAALLAPLHLLRDDPHNMSAKEIAEFFNISLSAATIRKPGLERLYRRQHGIERPLPKVVVDFLNELESKNQK